jgi:hypothetical protein
MTIAAKLKEKGVYHLHYMAPIGTAKLIAMKGILSFNEKQNAIEDPSYKTLMKEVGAESIAAPNVQFRRDGINIEGKPLHDYVPQYFGVHKPMQYVVTKKYVKNQDTTITFIEIATAMVFKKKGVLYTDGNAASGDTEFFRDASGIDQINWKIVLHTPNCYSQEYKRIKCAEVLVPDRVDPICIKRFIFLTERAQNDFKKWIASRKEMQLVERTPETLCDKSHFYNEQIFQKKVFSWH